MSSDFNVTRTVASHDETPHIALPKHFTSETRENTSPAYKIYVPPLPHFADDGSNVSGNMAAAELSAIYRAMQKSAARFSNYNVRE